MRKKSWRTRSGRRTQTELNKYPPHCLAYVIVAANVDCSIGSSDELEYLQNSRIGERAKRRKKLVDEEFDVLFSNEDLREEFERLSLKKAIRSKKAKKQR